MWDNITPLKLLETMPENLEDEHLEKLQMLLEADKNKNQIFSGTDLCGAYAPFCEGCNKENKYPCAVAYLNYLKEQRESEIPAEIQNDEAEPVTEEQSPAIDTVEEQQSATDNAEEQPQAIEEVKEVIEEVKTEEEPQKTKIRIAIARKKL